MWLGIKRLFFKKFIGVDFLIFDFECVGLTFQTVKVAAVSSGMA